MGQRERRACAAVFPVLMLILLSGCARRPTALTMAAPPPSARAEQIATATSEASPVDTPRVEVEAPEPPSPEASVPDAAAETPAGEPGPPAAPSSAEAAPEDDVNALAAPSPTAPSQEGVTMPSEPDTTPPAAEAPATASTPAPSEPLVAAAVPQEMTAPVEFRPADGLTTIHFDFDEYAIRPEDARILDENATWLKANKPYLVLIEGHADERGTSEYNLALGAHRAKAALDYLVALGVQRSRVTMVSYGKERPLCVERTEECWVKNRRAQFLVKPQ